MSTSTSSIHKRFALVSCGLLGLLPTQLTFAGGGLTSASPHAPRGSAEPGRTIDDLLEADPLVFLEKMTLRCRNAVQDFSCLFTKRERVNGRLQAEVRMRVLFRESPHSVHMVNAGRAASIKRVLYVAGRSLNPAGEELMEVEPAGWRRLLASRAEISIRDKRILAKNRKTIDQFGFSRVLERLHKVSRLAREHGDLDMQYAGTGRIDGRPTYILIRELPYSGPQGRYPDARAVVHIDQEWLLPVSVRSYSDHAGRVLLGRYELTEVSLNLGLDDAAFKF